MVDKFERLLEPLRRRISNTVGRAVIRACNDDGGVQLLQLEVLRGEIRDQIERLQNYGFTSVPKSGAEAVVVFAGGDRAHGHVVAVNDRRFRKKGMQPGEVAVYTDEGDEVYIKRGGTIQVKAATKLEVIAPLSTFSGAVEIGGALSVVGNISGDKEVSDKNGSMQEMRVTYNGHTHNESNVVGGPTSTPSGLMG